MAGKLEIDGLKKLISQVQLLQKEMGSAVRELSKLVIENNKLASSTSKASKSVNELTTATKKEVEYEEKSRLAQEKLNKITLEQEILKKRLEKTTIQTNATQLRYEQQINKVTAAKKKGAVATSEWGKALTSFQAKFNTIGNFFAVGLLGAIGGVIGALKTVIGWNDEFKKSLNSLGAITGLRGKDLQFLADEAKKTGRAMNMSATEMLGAYEKVGSLVPELLKNKEALAEVTKQAVLLSQASGGRLGLTETTAAVGSVMNQFNLSAGESARIVNVLAAAEVEGAAGTTDLTESFKNVGAVANSANVTFEQTSALLEVLASKQIVGAESGTKLRGSIIKLQDAGVGYQSGIFNINDALKELKTRIDSKSTAQQKDAEMMKVFGLENITVGKILLENISTYEELTKKITGTNTALEQAKIQTESASYEWKKLGLAIQDAFTGDTFQTISKRIAQFVQITASVIGGLGMYIFNQMRIIGESIYDAFRLDKLFSGGYLDQFEKMWKGYTARNAQYLNQIINPLDAWNQKIEASAKNTTKITEQETAKQDAILKESADEKEKRLKKEQEEREKYLERQREIANEEFKISQELASKKEEESRKADEKTIEDAINADQLKYEALKANAEAWREEQYRLADEKYAIDLEKAQGNYELTLQAEQEHLNNIMAVNEEFGQMMYDATTQTLIGIDEADQAATASKLDRAKRANDFLIGLSNQQREVEKANSQLKIALVNESLTVARKAVGEQSTMGKILFGLQKAMAIAQIWIDNYIGNAKITKSTLAWVAELGFITPPALAAASMGAALVAANNTNAALQTALIGVQAIPEIAGFYKGTKDAPGGLAWVGEKGTEIIKTPEGGLFLTPDHATKAFLPEHSEVIPNHLVKNELAEMGVQSSQVKENKVWTEILEAIKTKKETSINMDANGFSVHLTNKGNVTKFINDRYRC